MKLNVNLLLRLHVRNADDTEIYNDFIFEINLISIYRRLLFKSTAEMNWNGTLIQKRLIAKKCIFDSKMFLSVSTCAKSIN